MRYALVLVMVMTLVTVFGRAVADDVSVDSVVSDSLVQEYSELYALITAEGFDPDKRYLEDEMARIHKSGGQDPFWCGQLDRMIARIAEMSKQMWGEDSRLFRMWRKHEADYLVTNHICEDGNPYPRPWEAHKIYLELGLQKDAQRAALLHADNDFFAAAYGMYIYRPWLDIDKLARSAYLLEGIEWLRKAGKPDDFVLGYLNSWGQSLEVEGYNYDAARFYAASREIDDTIRALTKARTNPFPSETQMGQDFLNFLGASEAHP